MTLRGPRAEEEAWRVAEIERNVRQANARQHREAIRQALEAHARAVALLSARRRASLAHAGLIAAVALVVGLAWWSE